MKTLTADRHEAIFRLFFRKVKEHAGNYDVIGDRKLPKRSRSVQNIFHARNSVSTKGYVSAINAFYHESVDSHCC